MLFYQNKKSPTVSGISYGNLAGAVINTHSCNRMLFSKEKKSMFYSISHSTFTLTSVSMSSGAISSGIDRSAAATG